MFFVFAQGSAFQNHAELRSRLSAKAQKAIPTWFDEGLALQNDYRERYSEAQWIAQTDNGKNTVALEDMDTPAEFYAGEAEDRRFRYLNAKHELDVSVRRMPRFPDDAVCAA